jgi:hypothetical protein
LFVDAGASAGGANGQMAHAFQTIQAAVDQVITNAWNSAIIKIAPGTYAAGITVTTSASLTTLVLDSWQAGNPDATNADLPVISGNITVQPITGATSPDLYLANLNIISNIESSNLAVVDLQVHMQNCRFSPGTIDCLNLELYLIHTDFGGDAGGTNSFSLHTDGYSWAKIVSNGSALSPGYSRDFWDTGADVWDSNLNVTGLAIGASQAVTFPHPETRVNEYAMATKLTPFATDFQLVFSHTGVADCTFILTNLSRASTDFADDIRTVVFHCDMAQFVIP